MAKYKVFVGDCIERMQEIPDQTINCCVTSPPYFGLRDYGQDGQLGLEASPDEFVEALVRVFREVRRVLRDDGTVWLNLGDSYSRSTAKGGSGPGGKNKEEWGYGAAQAAKEGSSDNAVGRADRPGTRSGGLGEKQLLGIPWRVAFALQADGWYLRQDIIWHKPNPMPESVRDRCTKAHEYIFLLSKGAKYYYDHEASKENTSTNNGDKRNRRSVWAVNSRPYKGAHFATFPPDLIEPCILAGCPEGGVVLDPFGGSGTTAGVAITNNRNAVICELSEDYAGLIPERVRSIVDSKRKEAS